jgi:hypothetical protein
MHAQKKCLFSYLVSVNDVQILLGMQDFTNILLMLNYPVHAWATFSPMMCYFHYYCMLHSELNLNSLVVLETIFFHILCKSVT